MEFFRRATVAFANSPADAELLDYVTMIVTAAAVPVNLSFVHVVPPGVSTTETLFADGDSMLGALRSSAEQRLGPRGEVSFHVREGSRIDKLLEFAAESESDVILVGHRRARTGRRSLSRRLAMKAPCSLWMVPEGSSRTISHLLTAIDFSAASAHALSLTTLLARALGIPRCTAVYVHAPNALSPDDAVGRLVRDDGARAFERFMEPLELHGVQVIPRIEESGSVAAATLRAAAEEGADLVVMGTRGLSRSSAVLLGSESEQMLIESDRPVLVTKHRGDRIGLLEVLLDRGLQPQEEPRFG